MAIRKTGKQGQHTLDKRESCPEALKHFGTLRVHYACVNDKINNYCRPFENRVGKMIEFLATGSCAHVCRHSPTKDDLPHANRHKND